MMTRMGADADVSAAARFVLRIHHGIKKISRLLSKQENIMHRSLLLTLICLFLAASMSSANDDNFILKTFFEEGFEGSFPPSGWSVESVNEPTWRRVTPGSQDDWDAFDGIRSACVGGEGSGVLQERMITSRIGVAAEGVGFDTETLAFSFMAYAPDEGWLNQLIVEASTDPPDENNWRTLSRTYDEDIDNDDSGDGYGEAGWMYADVDIQRYLEEESVWIAFRFTGNADEMVCIDDISMSLLGEFGDGEGCGGCGLGGEQPGPFLIAFFILISLAGFAVARRMK